jgi:hypothetical protein
VVREQRLEAGIQERLEVAAQNPLDEPGIEKRREGVVEPEFDRGSASLHVPRRRQPFPGSAMARGQVPAGRDVSLGTARFRDHFLAREQTQLDADPANPMPSPRVFVLAAMSW